VFLADLGLAPPTALTKELLAAYGRDDLAELNEWFTRRHDRATQPERVAAARTVTAVAAQGDEVARAIVDEQGRRLALYAEVAARKVGLTERAAPVPVVLTGSVLTAPDSPVAAAMHRHAADLLPGADLHLAALPPAAGAALDAIAEAGEPVDAATVSMLGATAPPPEFLAT
jgi:N-acetylglucosamine kinase-like BadF-type ATPase